MTTLPLTVLFEEGPIARSYLVMLHQLGLRARSIVHLVPPPGSWWSLLPARVRVTRAAERQRRRAHAWAKRLPALYPGLYGEVTGAVSGAFDLAPGFFDEIRSNKALQAYTESVLLAEIDRPEDPRLARLLARQPESTVLFTGRGSAPGSLLTLPHRRVLSVHPAPVPQIRGADAVLWSTLVRSRPAASVLLLGPGIDAAAPVQVWNYEPLSFTVPDGEDPDDEALYRMVLNYYEPVLRAAAFCRLAGGNPDLSRLPVSPPEPAAGRVYHPMEPRLRHLALKRLFPRAGGPV